MITEEKLSLREVGRQLSLTASTIKDWLDVHREGRLGDIARTYRPLTDMEMEPARTKKELGE